MTDNRTRAKMRKKGVAEKNCRNKQNKDVTGSNSLAHGDKETDYTVFSRTIVMYTETQYRGSHNEGQKTYC